VYAESMRRFLFATLLALLSFGCGSAPKAQPESLSDYIYGSLALSPVAATGSGYHEHNGVRLDEQLDDYSPAGMEASRKFVELWEGRLAQMPSADPEAAADLELVRNQIALARLELDSIQSYKHNPTVYVELAGNALFTPYMLNYASAEDRFQHITARLLKLPALMAQAKANLVDAPEVWNRVAQEENDGNIALIDKTLRAAVPASKKFGFEQAAIPAIAALRDFNAFLKNDLAKKTSDWRLGKERYDQKFKYVLAIGKTPEQLLAEAEADFKRVRGEMEKLAAPKTVPQALDEIAKQHATPATYMDAARATLAEATAFVKEKDLLTLPARGNLQVIETPEFMRGIYAVGGFNPAPPLEPQLGAYYWITPVPANWPKERIESKLREYNDSGLQQLTIHEAMPGHYVQLEYANDVQPLERRLLRNLFASGPYVEGYAVYAQQVMNEAGYRAANHNLELTFYKQMLRVIANAILDIKIQTQNMTEKDAVDFMVKEGFQEKEEATAKWQRAQLSSCQLPMYFAGWRGWLNARDAYKAKHAADYSLKKFNEAALKESGVTLSTLATLLN
ncbi:MAG: hypothetical protein RL328_686, partial [Acidobacteriota bacterium]